MTYGMMMIYFYWIVHAQIIHAYAIQRTKVTTDDVSISSCSTTSTVDDNPGTGRLIDKYFYQRGGRKVERLIFWMWIKLPHPHPALVSHHILWKVRWENCRDRTISLPSAIRTIERNPLLQPITLPGLRNLVRQTQ